MLVTGDRGFSALLRELSNRQMTTVVIGNGHQKIPSILAQAADFSIQWDEMMETSDFNTKCNEKCKLSEDRHLEIGRWEASSSCNVLLKYESQGIVQVARSPFCIGPAIGLSILVLLARMHASLLTIALLVTHGADNSLFSLSKGKGLLR